VCGVGARDGGCGISAVRASAFSHKVYTRSLHTKSTVTVHEMFIITFRIFVYGLEGTRALVSYLMTRVAPRGLSFRREADSPIGVLMCKLV